MEESNEPKENEEKYNDNETVKESTHFGEKCSLDVHIHSSVHLIITNSQ